MMEVKQSTAVDLNDLLVKDVVAEGSDELDDAVMTDLTEGAHDLDVIKPIEKPNNGLATNGDDTLASLIDLDSTVPDLDAPVSTELEDALLAEDDVLPKLTDDVKHNSVPCLAVVEDILADKVETSNSTTSSNNVRDPGDDLDTLLSKINDIVDDCLDNDVAAAPIEEVLDTKVKEIFDSATDAKESKVDESVIVLDDTVLDESGLETDKTDQIELKDTNELKAKQPEDDVSDLLGDAELEQKAKLPVDTELNLENDIEKVVTDEIDEIAADIDDESVSNLNEDELLEDDADNISNNKVPIELAINEETSKTGIEEEKSEIVEEKSKVEEDSEMKEDEVKTAKPETQTVDEDCKMNGEQSEADAVESKLDEDESKNGELSKMDEEESLLNDEDSKLDEEVTKKDDDVCKTDEEESLLLNDEESKVDGEESKIDKVDPEPKIDEAVVEKDVEILNGDEKSENVTKVSTSERANESKDTDKVTLKEPLAKTVSTTSVEETKKDEKKPEAEQQTEAKTDHEDSDDEIVFFVDKPPDTEKTETSEGTETTAEKQSEEQKKEKTKSTDDEEAVVILDDEDEVATEKKLPEKKLEPSVVDKPKQNEEKSSEKDETIKKDEKLSAIDMDNSDNARDDFVTEKTAEVGTKEREADDNNSNCSTSSNLLLESQQIENTNDETAQDENENDNENDNDNENEEEDEDGDVELLDAESKEAENSSEKGEESSEMVPPAKRPRLSEDSEISSKTDETSKSQKLTETSEKKTDTQTDITSTSSTTTSLKRSHDVIELELDEEKSNDSKHSSTESLNKKARTEEDKPKEIAQSTDVEEKKAKKEEEVATTDEEASEKKEIIKMIPSEVPIPLYPPPKLRSLGSDESISLDFMKKFRKSFDNMTKQDLEELVLQKVVEAIIHKSEFADMRELLEKQEKLITSHRTKISELSKQFRDLEMVHNRVVKDIEQRNSQFIMPVKITRAVGLQVYIPNKKSAMEAATSSAHSTPNVPASPQRPTASPQNKLTTSPQRQFHIGSQADAPTRIGANSNASNTMNSSTNSAVPRRGCAQKITPTRPVPGVNNMSGGPSAASNVNTTIYRGNLTQNQISSQPRILNKNAATASSNNSPIQRQRQFVPPSQETAQRLQQQNARPAANTVVNSQRAVPQQKLPVNPPTLQRRAEPAASPTAKNSASLDTYMNTLSHLTGGNTAVSITPAKPKEKAVIDLTDEDELPAPPSTVSPQQTQNSAAPNQGQRRSLPVQNNNSNSTLQQQYGRTASTMTRLPPGSQMANRSKGQAPAQGQKSNSFTSTINTPPGTSITRINVAANTQGPQRVKYSHPAPLPATPAQTFNPSWKLPPPRPTIRISNLDNGIVISWTMEESMDRHAECVSYQIYAYQETSGPPMADSWRHVGDVKAMLLPMAVTLTQFQEGQRYFFAVRAVDCHQRYGPFSLPKTWS